MSQPKTAKQLLDEMSEADRKRVLAIARLAHQRTKIEQAWIEAMNRQLRDGVTQRSDS